MRFSLKNIAKSNTVLLLVSSMFFCGNAFAQEEENKELEMVSIQDSVVAVDTIVIEQVTLDTLATVTPVIIPDTIVVLSEQEKKNLEIDASIERKLKQLQNQVPLVYNKRIKSFIDYFSVRRPSYLLAMERRKNLFFPMFEEVLKKNGMPDEIKYLSIVESGLNPMAISRAGAAGLWQFMPGTGKEMGLLINDYIDERLDPYLSTDAACKYLLRMYRAFGDWELALASYNCGPGVVKRAVRQSGGKTFWKIFDYLPSETRGYVPQFVAVTYVMNNLSDYNMVADSIQYPMEVDTITIRQFVNLHVLCEKLEICYEDFVQINPAIRTNILPDNLNYPIRIPKEKKLEYLLNQHEILECVNVSTTPIEVMVNDRRKSSAGGSVAYRQKIIHTVRSGEVLGKIATKYGTTVTQLKAWNNLKSNTIRVGQKLVVYKVKYSNTKSKPTTSSSISAKPKSTPKFYYVKPGDTLWTISKKFDGLTIEKIKKLNKMSGNTIKVGQKLLLS